MAIKKCIISVYDKTITKPPYKTISIDTVEVNQPEVDHLGENLYNNMFNSCMEMGYRMKFYTTTRVKGYDYEIIVKN